MAEDGDVTEMLKDLTLLLLYLSSWEEEPIRGAPTICRAWKNHRFEILDALAEEGLLVTPHRAKWVRLTDEGLAKARALEATLPCRQDASTPAPSSSTASEFPPKRRRVTEPPPTRDCQACA